VDAKASLPVIAALALFVTACSAADRKDLEVRRRETRTPDFTELRANQKKWEDAGIEDYQYTIQLACFCPPQGDPFTFEVADGERSNMIYADSGAMLLEGPGLYEDWADFATIDDLFSMIEAAFRKTPLVMVKYDTDHGYPVVIRINRYGGLDGEVSHVITDFQKKP